MWEGKHLWKQIVLIEVFKVVDLVQSPQIIRGHILNLSHHLLIVEETAPEQAVVVLILVVLGRLIIDLLDVRGIF